MAAAAAHHLTGQAGTKQPSALGPMRAWRVFVPTQQAGPVSLTMARTRGGAISRNLANAQGAGYTYTWKDFRVKRAKEFDDAFAKHGAFNWSYAHAMLVLQPQAQEQA